MKNNEDKKLKDLKAAAAKKPNAPGYPFVHGSRPREPINYAASFQHLCPWLASPRITKC